MSQSRLTETDLAPGAIASRGPHRIGIINDYVRVSFANGSSFASQLLYREFSARGHHVTVIGPSDPEAVQAELPRHVLALRSVPLRSHPGVHLPLPSRDTLAQMARSKFDLLLAQS